MREKLVLASGSPRRRDLLAAAGYSFVVVSPQVDELHTPSLTMRELTCCNATRKGLAVTAKRRDAVVLAADTLVALDRSVIGKPVDFDDARAILRRLSGRTHAVCSCVFVSHAATRRRINFHELSRVTFRKLDEKAIREYLARIDPLDKAGAYAAQGHGSDIIESIDGSFTNVVGLPMEQTTAVLRQFGIDPRA
jgi:septum formation protein